MRVVTVAQMKQIEKLADANGVSYYQMMENAGTAAYHILRQRVPHAKHIAVVAGKGNNGGDGFVMARLAAQDGLSVTVVLAEGEPVTRDAKTNYALLHALPVAIQTADTVRSIHADVVVDALYGTGFHGSLRPSGQKACDFMRTSGAYVLALDVPSGLQADTGIAADGAVKAQCTVAFDSYKQVHIATAATALCGTVVLADLGVPDDCHPHA